MDLHELQQSTGAVKEFYPLHKTEAAAEIVESIAKY